MWRNCSCAGVSSDSEPAVEASSLPVARWTIKSELVEFQIMWRNFLHIIWRMHAPMRELAAYFVLVALQADIPLGTAHGDCRGCTHKHGFRSSVTITRPCLACAK